MGRLLGCALGCLPMGSILALVLLAQAIANIGFGVASAEMGATILTQTLVQPIYMLLCGVGGFLVAVPTIAALYIAWRIRQKNIAEQIEEERMPALPGSARRPELPTAQDTKALPQPAPGRVIRRRRVPQRRTITIPRNF